MINQSKIDEVDIAETRSRKNMQLFVTILFALIIATVVIGLSLKGNNSILKREIQSLVRVGVPAPDFTFSDLNGKRVSLSDHRGKVVLINIWATWCAPCREEMPSMEKLYNRFKGEDFEILAVSIDSTGQKAVAPFMQKLNLTFPALLDPEAKIRGLYSVTGVPESFIVDKKGIVVKKVIGAVDWATPKVFSFFQDLIQRPQS